ncbi:MAG TPA: hypothetical protein VGJ41_09775, partial [Nocardioides sp.]
MSLSTRWRVGAALTALATGALGALVGAVPATAAPATVSVSRYVLTFQADAGQANVLRLSLRADGTILVDDVVPVEPGAGCTAVPNGDGTAATCGGDIRNLNINTGDGDDEVTDLAGKNIRVDAGEGDDSVVLAGAGQAWAARTELVGGPGADTLVGGAGEDHLDGGPGADWLSGGSGIHDGVTYAGRTAAVTVDIDDGFGDDGEAGEGDTVRTDIEAVTGGAGNDRLTGSDAFNNLFGEGGDDTIFGLGSGDWIHGGGGTDSLYGGGGDDGIWGDDGDRNLLDGGPGNDELS